MRQVNLTVSFAFLNGWGLGVPSRQAVMRSVIHKIVGLCEDAVVFVVMLPFALWRFARWLGISSLKWRQSVTILPIVRGD